MNKVSSDANQHRLLQAEQLLQDNGFVKQSDGKYKAPEYLTLEEVAGTLKVSPQTVKNYLKKGILKGIIFGEASKKNYRVAKSNFESFISNSLSDVIEQ